MRVQRLAAGLATLALCTVHASAQQPPSQGAYLAEIPAALDDLHGKSVGTVTFMQFRGAVLIRGELTGLPPGWHAIHVHETGKCEPPFESAGDHFNPSGYQHGFEQEQHHAGDLPNIWVHDDGTARFEMITTRLALTAPQVGRAADEAVSGTARAAGAPTGTSVVGRALVSEPPALVLDDDGAAVVIHSEPDDYRTDPAGASGDRIACGVLR